MIFPLLEYVDTLIAKGVYSYSSKDVAAARLALLKPTRMLDFVIDVYKSLNETQEVPKEMEEQKQQVLKQMEELQQGCAALDKLCQNEGERVGYYRARSHRHDYHSHKYSCSYHSPSWWQVDNGMCKPCKKSIRLPHK